MLRSRLEQHRKTALGGIGVQGEAFRGGGALWCSWVENREWYAHQRLELENDLIGAHVLGTGRAPTGQFLG